LIAAAVQAQIKYRADGISHKGQEPHSVKAAASQHRSLRKLIIAGIEDAYSSCRKREPQTDLVGIVGPHHLQVTPFRRNPKAVVTQVEPEIGTMSLNRARDIVGVDGAR